MKDLTLRELTCLRWVSVGKTSWETGRILGLKERTINHHIQNACRKLGVHSRQAAVTIAMRNGLLSFDDPSSEPEATPRTVDGQSQHSASSSPEESRDEDISIPA